MPGAAQPHLVNTGLGPVYDGISHVLLSPEDLIPLLAMALLAGLKGISAARQSLFALTGAWLAGTLAGLYAGDQLAIPALATTISFLALGIIPQPTHHFHPSLVTIIAIIVGILGGGATEPV